MGMNHDLMLSLGNRIKQARERIGITQEELADSIGVSRTTIARYELGEIEPKLRNLVALAERLSVSADYLLGVDPMNFHQLELSEEALMALQDFIKAVRK